MPSKKQLLGFFSVAETGSFNKASKRLFISSTALLQQINLLENELGFRLFIRTKKGVKLTSAGDYYYKEAKRLCACFQTAAANAKSIAQRIPNIIRIGYYSHISLKVINELNQRIAKDHHCSFLPQSIPMDSISKQLLQQQVDCLLLPKGEETRKLELPHKIVYSHPLMVGIPPTIERLTRKEVLHLEDLEGETLVLPDEGIFDSTDNLRYLLQEKNIHVRILSITSNIDTEVFCIQNNACRISSIPLIGSPLVFHPLDCGITYDLALVYPNEQAEVYRELLLFLEL